jgi:hypothetical protein
MAGVFTRMASGLRSCERFITNFISKNVYETVMPEEGRPLPPARCRINKSIRKIREAHAQQQERDGHQCQAESVLSTT